VSPTPRLAALVAATALGFLFLPPALPALVVVALLAGAAGDTFAVRRRPELTRTLPAEAPPDAAYRTLAAAELGDADWAAAAAPWRELSWSSSVNS